jgi:hypothetical protein
VIFRQRAQAFGGLFWRNVALRFGEQLEADHEFAHSCRAQEWRIGMRMQMPGRVGRTIGGALVEAERIGEWDLEQVIVACRQSLKDVRQTRAFLRRQVAESANVSATDDHRLEGPDGPEGNQRNEVIIGADEALFALEFERQVIGEQRATGCFQVVALRDILAHDCQRQRSVAQI